MSVRELADKDFVSSLRKKLEGQGIDPTFLQLEVTETSLLKELGRTAENRDRLGMLGIGTAIDDFGTGYSSLSYLRTLNCDVLKIDRSFVCEIATDEKAAALCGCIVSMGQKLNLRVVAEGVETIEQLNILREQKCDFVQGYLIAKPMPAHKMTYTLTSDWQLYTNRGLGGADTQILKALKQSLGTADERGSVAVASGQGGRNCTLETTSSL